MVSGLSQFLFRRASRTKAGEEEPPFDAGFLKLPLAGAVPALEAAGREPFVLTMFAAEDEGRTFDPTERKKQEERRKGRVPKSQDLTGAVVMLAGFITLFFLGEWIITNLTGMMRHYLGDFNQITIPQTPVELGALLRGIVWDGGKLVLPVFIAVLIFGIAGNIVQVGFLFSTEPLAWKWERIKPNFKKVFFSMQMVFNLLKALAKLAAIGFVAFLLISFDYLDVLRTTDMGLGEGMALVSWIGFKLLIVIGVLLLVLGIPDYMYQRYEFIESIKMTREQVKEEHKEQEGDANIKAKQRERGRQMAQGQMLDQVPDASVVITNPEHYAVALRYNENDSQPIVVAKGVDGMAQRIKTIARDNGVEVRRNPPLARSLYADVEIGDPIPAEFFRAVSLVFATLRQFQDRRAG